MFFRKCYFCRLPILSFIKPHFFTSLFLFKAVLRNTLSSSMSARRNICAKRSNLNPTSLMIYVGNIFEFASHDFYFGLFWISASTRAWPTSSAGCPKWSRTWTTSSSRWRTATRDSRKTFRQLLMKSRWYIWKIWFIVAPGLKIKRESPRGFKTFHWVGPIGWALWRGRNRKGLSFIPFLLNKFHLIRQPNQFFCSVHVETCGKFFRFSDKKNY